ncbi:carbohydrate binding domain-containing protein [Sphingomonas sp. HF-S3]|uniref:Carbohydrate binding domain-containing protein n=1 Tax=Sphingomonas rustica TaxID=3103142 RepID=A0ABV0BA97_9SPHN
MTIRIALAVSTLAASIALIPAPLRAQTAPAAPAPAAEPVVLNGPHPEELIVYGLPGGGKPKLVKDDKVQFGKALRLDTPGGGEAWTVGVNSPLTGAVKKGDKILVAFYARLEKGAGGATTARVNGQLQLSNAPYTQLYGKAFDITTEWKLYQVVGRADRDYAAGELSAALHVNTAKQTLDIGAIAVLDYGQK